MPVQTGRCGSHVEGGSRNSGKETGIVHLIHRSSSKSEEEVLLVAIISKVEEEIP